MAIDVRRVKVHFTHKLKIKKLYQEGYTRQELAIMYKLPQWYINLLTQQLDKAEQI